MGTIETVRGPIEASELGATLMHEHIFIKNPELKRTIRTPNGATRTR